MGIITLEWKPENDIYPEKKAISEIADDATLSDQFELWKEQMGFLGYHTDRYELTIEEGIEDEEIA